MISALLKYESVLYGVLFTLLLLFVATGLYYPVVELQGPYIRVFLPSILGSGVAFAFLAGISSQPVMKSARIGSLIGFAASFALFLSNILISEPYKDGYVVSEARVGRGKSVNWVVSTTERENVLLNIHINGISTETSPEDVHLALYRGWLGFYFGNKA